MEREEVLKELKKPVEYTFEGNEKEFEEHIVLNIDMICEGLGLSQPEEVIQQKQIRFEGSQIIMDIIVMHKDKTVTMFEVKKINSKHPHTATNAQMNSVGQMLLYKNVLEAYTGVPVRVALIAEKIFPRTMIIFNKNRLPLTLIEFQKDKIFVPYKNM